MTTIRNNKELRLQVCEMYNNNFSAYEVAKQFNIHFSTVYRILKENNIQRRSNKENSRIYTVNHHYFENINTEEKAYWLGFIYADGYITQKNGQKKVGLALNRKDKEHLEKFVKSLDSNYPVKDYKQKTNFTDYEAEYSRVLLTSEKMYQDLKNKNVFERKSNILIFPNEKIVPSNLIRHFIRGYFDGDGSVSKTEKSSARFSFCGTKEFLIKLNNYLFENLNLNTNIEYRYPENKKGEYIRYNTQANCKAFYEHIYKNTNIFLNRKKEKFEEIISHMDERENEILQKNTEILNELQNVNYSMEEIGKKFNISKAGIRHYYLKFLEEGLVPERKNTLSFHEETKKERIKIFEENKDKSWQELADLMDVSYCRIFELHDVYVNKGLIKPIRESRKEKSERQKMERIKIFEENKDKDYHTLAELMKISRSRVSFLYNKYLKESLITKREN